LLEGSNEEPEGSVIRLLKILRERNVHKFIDFLKEIEKKNRSEWKGIVRFYNFPDI